MADEANYYSFTYWIFTDGISMCENSKINILPVVCNELPPEDRFCIDNILFIIFLNKLINYL
jgi:hypothetical protein